MIDIKEAITHLSSDRTKQHIRYSMVNIREIRYPLLQLFADIDRVLSIREGYEWIEYASSLKDIFEHHTCEKKHIKVGIAVWESIVLAEKVWRVMKKKVEMERAKAPLKSVKKAEGRR